MQKTAAPVLSALITPVVMAKAGTTASSPMRPPAESAHRRRAVLSGRPAWWGASGATQMRSAYSARKIRAATTMIVVSAFSTIRGSSSIDDSVTASNPAPSTARWKVCQRRAPALLSECQRIA